MKLYNKPHTLQMPCSATGHELVRHMASKMSTQVSWPNVAMLTAIPPTPCKAPLADLVNSLSLVNKVRTCRNHLQMCCCRPNVYNEAGNLAWLEHAAVQETHHVDVGACGVF
jgi:hypothetical protein